MPLIHRGSATLANLVGVILGKLLAPVANGFVSHLNAPIEHDLLDIAVAQGTSVVEPDTVTDDFDGKAVTFVASLHVLAPSFSRSELTTSVKLTMPIGGADMTTLVPISPGYDSGPPDSWDRSPVYNTVDIAGSTPSSAGIPEDILWHKATEGGANAYVNPHDSGKVQVTVSSNPSGYNVNQVVSRANGLFFTTDNAFGSWVVVDFDPQEKGNWVCPDTFYISHGYATFLSFRLQNFSLQGSNGTDVHSGPWQDLVTISNSIVVADPSVNPWSYEIPILGLDPEVDQFRFLRLYQTGLNSNSNYHLAVGNWLLGGSYREF